MITNKLNNPHDRFFRENFNHPEITRSKLELLEAAEQLEDLRILPANCLEKLPGNREGQ